MQKFYFIGLLLALIFSSKLPAEDISGFWQIMDKKKNKPSSVIAIYPYQGNYYARIIATYNDQGELEDNIYHPISRAPGLSGKPHYCGLDIVWHAVPDQNGKYKGSIVDPKRGKVYDAVLRKKGENVILRGEFLMIGKNVTCSPFPESMFNKVFKKPDLKTFIPKDPSSYN